MKVATQGFFFVFMFFSPVYFEGMSNRSDMLKYNSLRVEENLFAGGQKNSTISFGSFQLLSKKHYLNSSLYFEYISFNASFFPPVLFSAIIEVNSVQKK